MYPITNIHMSTVEGDEESDVLVDQDDELSNWIYEQSDQGPSCGPFMANSYSPVENLDKKPEVYFQALFDEHMWTIISDATNVYTLSKRTTPDGNMCLDPTHPQYKKHRHLNTWTDVTPSEIKMFMAHILLMGLVQKSELEKYWQMNSMTKIPFFGKYMSRNRFQALLWNIHVNDDTQIHHIITQTMIHCVKLDSLLTLFRETSSMRTNLQNVCHLMKPVVLSKVG